MAKKAVAKTYKRNYLSKVTLKCDYDYIELGKLEEYADKLKTIFPFQESEDSVNREMQIDFMEGKILSNSGVKSKQWKLLTADKNKYLIITPNFIALEYINGSYKNKNILISDLASVINPFFDIFQINTVNRIGLRYINDVDLNHIKKDFKFDDYFNKNLLGGININKQFKNDLARTISTTEMKQDQTNIRFTYGIWNKDYPNENTRREFILDIYCYSKFPQDTDLTLSLTIQEYNKIAENIFEKSITEKLRVIMRK